LPVDTLVAGLPGIALDAEQAGRLLLGRPLLVPADAEEGRIRAYGPDGRFLGLVASDGKGGAVPLRLVSTEGRPAETPEIAGNA
jgi:hypothetical protein